MFDAACQPSKKEHFDTLMRLKRDRHAAFNWTPYIQEPNIKNGIGGLRDFQTMRWKALLNFGSPKIEALMRRGLLSAAEYKALRRAFGFLLRVRNDLHFQTNRPTDVLDLENQPSVARASRVRGRDGGGARRGLYARGLQVFPGNRHAIQDREKAHGRAPSERRLGDNAPAWFARPRNRKYEIDGFFAYRGEISAVRRGVFKRKPARILRLFQYCQAYGCAPSDTLEVELKDARELIDDAYRADPENRRRFLSILQFRGRRFPRA